MKQSLHTVIMGRIIAANNWYMFSQQDLEWLDIVAPYWNGENTNESILKAFSEAAENNGHTDPFELAVDANVCDSEREIIK